MSVELSPPELGFKRPFTQEVSQTLRLRNPNSDPVVFKVKTTAPKQYCVRPNSGRIEAGKEIEIQVLLQAMKTEPPPDARCRDKFLVQSVTATADKEITTVAAIWSHMEQTAKHTIQEKKIRVVFLDQDDPSGVQSTNATASDDAQRSPSPEIPHAYHSVVGTLRRPSDSTTAAETASPLFQSTIGSVISTVSSAIPTSTEELQAQLKAARETIARLEQQIPQGLRQRKGESADSKENDTSSNLAVQQAPLGGVPVQVAAGLCLFSFLLAYFFF